MRKHNGSFVIRQRLLQFGIILVLDYFMNCFHSAYSYWQLKQKHLLINLPIDATLKMQESLWKVQVQLGKTSTFGLKGFPKGRGFRVLSIVLIFGLSFLFGNHTVPIRIFPNYQIDVADVLSFCCLKPCTSQSTLSSRFLLTFNTSKNERRVLLKRQRMIIWLPISAWCAKSWKFRQPRSYNGREKQCYGLCYSFKH